MLNNKIELNEKIKIALALVELFSLIKKKHKKNKVIKKIIFDIYLNISKTMSKSIFNELIFFCPLDIEYSE